MDSIAQYLPLLILLILGVLVCTGILILTTLLGPKNPLASKLDIYECGVKPVGEAHVPFSLQFYRVAVLFLLFDVEGVFFFPLAKG